MASRVDLVPKQLASQVMGVTALGADIPFVAGNISVGHQVDCTGKELLLVYNMATGGGTVTISGKADEFGRTGNITAYAVAAGAISVFGPFQTDAFRQTTPAGKLLVDESAVTMMVAVLRLP